MVILEKAWAKLHSNFEAIEGGVCTETIKDLCGAPGFDIEITDPKLWQKIVFADQHDHIMTCAIHDGDSKKFEALGLVNMHAYSLIAAAEVDGHKIVQLRNPWGKFEWKGDWSDHSSLWTEENKKQVNYVN